MAQRSNNLTPEAGSLSSYLRDERVLQIIAQVVFVIVVVVVLGLLINSMFGQLAARNLSPNFDFLRNRAGFELAETPISYAPDNSYMRAFLVGLVNTLRVVSIGLVLTTLLGIFVGIFLLSNNWLLRNIARVYVELLRNTPLLVQIFVWYFIVVLAFPPLREALLLPAARNYDILWRHIAYVVAGIIYLVWAQQADTRAERRLLYQAAGVVAVVLVEIIFRQIGHASTGLDFVVFFLAIIVGFLFAQRSGSVWLTLPIALIVVWRVGQSILGDGGFARELNTTIRPVVILSNRGLYLPQFSLTASFGEWFVFVMIGIVVALIIWVWAGRITETTGRPIPRGLYAILVILAGMLIGWLVIRLEPRPALIPMQQGGATVMMSLDEARANDLLTPEDERLYMASPIQALRPQPRGLRVVNATQLTPEYLALLLALVVYTSAFIAEIVRAGIQAVPKGQIEASRAVGLSQAQVLRMVILPQALRVIIPPLGNQYLNLSKNSSLAIAIAFNDVFQVSSTIINQSAQSVSGIVLVLVTFLIISLLISAFMNWINKRFQLVTR